MIGRIISETTVAIWNCLHETYMPMDGRKYPVIFKSYGIFQIALELLTENIYAYKSCLEVIQKISITKPFIL
jgi:hypothetical protein